jgi:hypothetical protein
MIDSLRRLRVLRDAGVHIVYGHAPEFWASVPQAPCDMRRRNQFIFPSRG